MNLNPMCVGNHCQIDTGEVRVLPLPGSLNLNLCRQCFNFEMDWREYRNKHLHRDEQFHIFKWDELTVYRP